MKGKILIVLFSLTLVFGALIASCDDGVYPDWEANKNATDAKRPAPPPQPIQPPASGKVLVDMDGDGIPDSGSAVDIANLPKTRYDAKTGDMYDITYEYVEVQSGYFKGEIIAQPKFEKKDKPSAPSAPGS